MKDFQVSQLTKEMVVTRLKALGDPCVAAVDVARTTLEVILRSSDSIDPSTGAIKDVCQGTMVGLILTDQSLTRGAQLLLEMVIQVNARYGLDPQETSKSAIHGIAGVAKYVSMGQLDELRVGIRQISPELDIMFHSAVENSRLRLNKV